MRKFGWVESITVVTVIISLILVARPYVERLSGKARVTSARESLSALNYGLFAYHTDYGTFPTSDDIYDLDSLKAVLSPYVEDLDNLFFSFQSYEGEGDSYTLRVRVRDKVLERTPAGVRIIVWDLE